ncbi:condensation domain-containing protein, partial [Marilutibacter spongiae]
GEIEQVLASRPGVRQALVVAHRSDEAPTRLVAYVAVDGGPGDATEVQAALRRDLSERLPAYMVPSSIMVLPGLPLTANGKVDRQRLPAPVYRAAEGGVAPRDATEATLAEVWCSVLRLESVGVHDNFFEIGGDSILSIQVVARANQAGLAISTRQLFEAQTIAELARVAQGATGVQAPQEDIEGAMPLLPIQRAFLEDGDVDRHHFNQSVLLETPAGFELSRLRALVAALYARHDALRLRFEATASGWRAAHAARTAEMVAASCVHERLPGPVSSSAAFIAERCTHWQSAFDLASGPLLRAVWFEGTSPDEGRLLLAVHHAVVDGVSWRILLADLERAHAQQEAGEAIALPAKTSSFRQWGEALAGYAQSPALAAEGAYWQAQA